VIRLALALLLFVPAATAQEPIACVAQGGCAWVPIHLIERMNELADELKRENTRLRALSGCA
jgi:hypothetical protein